MNIECPSLVLGDCYQFRFTKLSTIKTNLSQTGVSFAIADRKESSIQFPSTKRLDFTLGGMTTKTEKMVSWRSGVFIARIWVLWYPTMKQVLSPLLWNGCQTGGWKIHLNFGGLTFIVSYSHNTSLSMVPSTLNF